MKKIGKFLFVEQCFTDTKETKPYIIRNDPDNFFTEFENLISSEEEEW